MTRGPSIANPPASWTAAALVAVMGLATLNWHVSNSGVDISPLSVASPRGDERAAPPSTSSPTPKPAAQSDYTETLKRPLFTPTRRPFEPVKPNPPEPNPAKTPDIIPLAQPPTLQVKLVGYTASPQRGKRALVRTANERVGTWMSIGDQVDGWRLRELSADRATFEYGTQRQELLLETKSQTPERAQAKSLN
jgi:hypothetical protein